MPVYHQLESFNEVILRLAQGGKRLKVLLDPRAGPYFLTWKRKVFISCWFVFNYVGTFPITTQTNDESNAMAL